jgi:hypothetical protein
MGFLLGGHEILHRHACFFQQGEQRLGVFLSFLQRGRINAYRLGRLEEQGLAVDGISKRLVGCPEGFHQRQLLFAQAKSLG